MNNMQTFSLSVTLVGRTNSGKSSLINTIVGKKLNIVSPRPNSTLKVNTFAFHISNCELVFFDTPGLFNAPRGKAATQKIIDSRINRALQEAETIVFLVAANRPFEPPAKEVLKIFESKNKIGLITKWDLVKDPWLIQEKVDALKAIGFKNIMSISIYEPQMIDDFVQELKKMAKESEFLYEPAANIPNNIFLIKEQIRQAIFDNTYQEMPYSSTIYIAHFQESETKMRILATIFVAKKSQVGIFIGKEGSKIRKMRLQAAAQIESLFNKSVELLLQIKVAKNWTKNPQILKKVL